MSSPKKVPASPALVVDGSGPCFFAGILGSSGAWLDYRKAEAPALESLFPTVDEVLRGAGVDLSDIRSFVYCEGPGSVLGLRLCAMAIETWRRIYETPARLYGYNSLKLVAAELLRHEGIREEALLISDWKKDSWNSLKIADDGLGEVAPVSAGELSQWKGPLYHLPARKGWQKPPDRAQEVSYNPESLASLLPVAELLAPREKVELYNSGVNSFRKWTPERHRKTPEQAKSGGTSPAPL